jgi:hypothetical protein
MSWYKKIRTAAGEGMSGGQGQQGAGVGDNPVGTPSTTPIPVGDSDSSLSGNTGEADPVALKASYDAVRNSYTSQFTTLVNNYSNNSTNITPNDFLMNISTSVNEFVEVVRQTLGGLLGDTYMSMVDGAIGEYSSNWQSLMQSYASVAVNYEPAQLIQTCNNYFNRMVSQMDNALQLAVGEVS